MSLKAMYNEIAENYKTADRFGSISLSQQTAVEQIYKEHLGLRPSYKVLDFGVGNGQFLEKLRPLMPQAEFTGFDISTDRLNSAKERLALTTIAANALEAVRYLPPNSQDLVLAHFINACIPIAKLFEQASLLTRANGYFSFITTTYESFPIAQANIANFISKGSLLSTIVGHYYKTMVKNTAVAADFDELTRIFAAHQFKIVSHQRLSIPITLKNINELALFGIDGTWFLNSLSLRMLPKNFLLERLKRLFSEIFTFPYQDHHIIDIILAKK